MNPFSLTSLYTLHNNLRNQKIILAFESRFSQDVIKKLLSITENQFDSMGEEAGLKKKVFNVMVECLQNICKHLEDKEIEEQDRYGLFLIGKDEDGYFLVSGNIIQNDAIPGLKSRIDEVNSLDKEGLKDLYMKKIKETELSDKGGAGLGLIDIARKSGQKLEYFFEQVSDSLSFYSLKTKISNKTKMEII